MSGLVQIECFHKHATWMKILEGGRLNLNLRQFASFCWGIAISRLFAQMMTLLSSKFIEL